MIRKTKISYTPSQKLEYAKLIVEENYTNKKIQEFSGAFASAIARWKRQYLAELSGYTP
ncbi:MAG: hypothetical protein ACJAXJ_002892 [Colwellia sp.]|jgi:uncharacterized protein YerC